MLVGTSVLEDELVEVPPAYRDRFCALHGERPTEDEVDIQGILLKKYICFKWADGYGIVKIAQFIPRSERKGHPDPETFEMVNGKRQYANHPLSDTWNYIFDQIDKDTVFPRQGTCFQSSKYVMLDSEAENGEPGSWFFCEKVQQSGR